MFHSLPYVSSFSRNLLSLLEQSEQSDRLDTQKHPEYQHLVILKRFIHRIGDLNKALHFKISKEKANQLHKELLEHSWMIRFLLQHPEKRSLHSRIVFAYEAFDQVHHAHQALSELQVILSITQEEETYFKNLSQTVFDNPFVVERVPLSSEDELPKGASSASEAIEGTIEILTRGLEYLQKNLPLAERRFKQHSEPIQFVDPALKEELGEETYAEYLGILKDPEELTRYLRIPHEWYYYQLLQTDAALLHPPNDLFPWWLNGVMQRTFSVLALYVQYVQQATTDSATVQ